MAHAALFAVDMSNKVPGSNLANGPDVLVCAIGPDGGSCDLKAVREVALQAPSNRRQGLGLSLFWAASNGTNVDVAHDLIIPYPDVVAVVHSDRTDTADHAARGEDIELIVPGVEVSS